MVDKTVAVVVTYNRLELLKHCIGRLQEQTHLVNDIIVVNNGSIDGTTARLVDSAARTALLGSR